MLPIPPWMSRSFNVSGSKVLFHHVFQDLVFCSAVNGGSKGSFTVPQFPKHIPKTVHIRLAVVDLFSVFKDFRSYVYRGAANCTRFCVFMLGYSHVCNFHHTVRCQLHKIKNIYLSVQGAYIVEITRLMHYNTSRLKFQV